jgi:AraC family transcriptional regulator
VNRTHITIVNQAVDFIVDNLFDHLSVDMIADHCCFSRHYFNRVFKSVSGESIYGFIRRLRLETGAFKLIKFPHLTITVIAAELGYSSSNFSVLFKNHFGISPSRFRSNPVLPLNPGTQKVLDRIKVLQENRPEKLLRRMDRQIRFKELPGISVIYQRFKGNYEKLPLVWSGFCDRMAALYPGAGLAYYGISYDDPMIAGRDRCQYDLCVRVTDQIKAGTRNRRRIAGGAFLCYRFDGRAGELAGVYNDLFGVWMPHQRHIMGPGLCFERYYEATDPPDRLVMDICVPVLS